MWLLLLPFVLLLYNPAAAVEQALKPLNLVLQLRLRVFFALCAIQLGLFPLITSGKRSAAEQNRLHALDARNPPAGNSSHERGEAVDVNFKDAAGNLVLRKITPREKWLPVVELAKLCGLRWGGDFRTYYDPVHFDLGA